MTDAAQASTPWTHWMSAFSDLARGPNEAMKAWEVWVGERTDEVLRSGPILERAGRAMGRSMKLKAQSDRMTEQWLRAMRMPTQSDLEQVFQRLDEQDRVLDQLAETLDALVRGQQALVAELAAPAAAPQSRRPRTRKS